MAGMQTDLDDSGLAQRKEGGPGGGDSIATRYRMLGVINDLHHGKTVIGEDKVTRDRVIIKVIRMEALSRNTRARLEHESSIRHLHTHATVAPVIDFGRVNDEFHVVMPLIEGL